MEEKTIFDILYDDNDDENVVLSNEKGEEVEFEQVAIFEIDGNDYAMLHPVTEIEGVDEDMVMLFLLDEEKGRITVVKDQNILDEAYAIYEELLEEAE